MKIAIVGYGRMGQVVEQHVLNRGDVVTIIIDPKKGTDLQDLIGKDFDVIIEFSVPTAALENMAFYSKHNMKVVMATTGWYDRVDEVKQMFQDSDGAVLWSGNFSIGVNLFWHMLEHATKAMNNFHDYDVFGHAFHHRTKVDSPSGTAIMTGNIILDNIDRKTEMIYDDPADRAIGDHELHFSSTSGGSIPGTHSVYFDSPYDTIKIEHMARTRDGFADGALKCGKWLADKKGYYEINDFIKNIIV